ncbi:ammonium transporter [candidate division FCPU426 bacterium]|nr:ammonium transporter [candidate division FCPU426 bacterium]
MSAGDTGFIMLSAALVMIMTPGLGLFYGGMVRTKNVLGTIMQSFAVLGIISIQWVLWGYSLAFGQDIGNLIGSLEFIGLKGVGQEAAPLAPTIPHLGFMVFQAMFAIITPALIAGALAERVKFSVFLLFVVLWSTLVYDPLAHWIWGGGWLADLGALDFAGGTVVHIASGVSALVVSLVLGKRRGLGNGTILPHNLTMVLIGTALLWFGWFGFNAGSALAANGLAVSAFVVTNISAAAAMVSWMALEWLLRGKPTALGAASGAVAGLVAITPAAGFVNPLAAIVIGTLVSPVCFGAIQLKGRLGYDDSLDAFGVHGVGGTWGALATGIFASTAVNPNGANGLLYGNPGLLGVQCIAVAATILFCGSMTFVIIKLLDATLGLRVPEHEEVIGLDLTQHGEAGYHNM